MAGTTLDLNLLDDWTFTGGCQLDAHESKTGCTMQALLHLTTASDARGQLGSNYHHPHVSEAICDLVAMFNDGFEDDREHKDDRERFAYLVLPHLVGTTNFGPVRIRLDSGECLWRSDPIDGPQLVIRREEFPLTPEACASIVIEACNRVKKLKREAAELAVL